MMPLETPRLRLRGWRDADVLSWIALGADERVMEFFPTRQDRSRAEARAAAMRDELERDGYGWWVVEIKGGAPFAGVIALQPLPFEAPFAPAFEIGWRFAHAAWGRGYATEGARAALAFAFTRLKLDEVLAITAAVNLRSQRVMQRLGMRRDESNDFAHPWIVAGHPLQPHVLYRIRRDAFALER